jgi:Phytanoyl-CoA dioxygenase (PhyH)
MEYLKKTQLDEFDKNGFFLLKNVLSKEEVNKLREITVDFFTKREDEVVFSFSGKTKPNALNCMPDLAEYVFKNPNVINIMKDLCGKDVRYGHHSDIHFNMLSGWHKDNRGHDDWATGKNGDTFKCYKMAFYFQDHTNNSDGLTVRKGSHLTKVLHDGELYDVPSESGDAVVFDMRISHIGKKANLIERGINTILKSGKARFRLYQGIRNTFKMQDKISLFFAFGVPNQFIDEHIDVTINRQNKQNTEGIYIINPKLAKSLEAAEIYYKL